MDAQTALEPHVLLVLDANTGKINLEEKSAAKHERITNLIKEIRKDPHIVQVTSLYDMGIGHLPDDAVLENLITLCRQKREELHDSNLYILFVTKDVRFWSDSGWTENNPLVRLWVISYKTVDHTLQHRKPARWGKIGTFCYIRENLPIQLKYIQNFSERQRVWRI